jgi:alkylated DNA repair dioxygenase AlkB
MKDLEIDYYKEFIDNKEAQEIHNFLLYNIPWKEEYITIFGKEIKCPRKVYWCGDYNLNYKYSGKVHKTDGWSAEIKHIKRKIEEYTHYKFNFVLLNYYNSGNDYMGWHSDNEKSLGIEPIIASLSIGSDREMLFKHKKTKIIKKILLENRSLLIMKGDTQEQYLHSIPKRKNILAPRINLTFRLIK